MTDTDLDELGQQITAEIRQALEQGQDVDELLRRKDEIIRKRKELRGTAA